MAAPRRLNRWLAPAATAMALVAATGLGQAQTPPGAAPLASLPSLTVAPYMGRWYQVALYPNTFQKQCVSDTTADYQQRPDGRVTVLNRCRDASGRIDEAQGLARPVGGLADGELKPAQLQVSFLPSWLRWAPVGWGDYWVIQLASDYRYAVVSEPSRRYLWVLSRTPALAPDDDRLIRQTLQAQGFDLGRLQAHPQRPAP